jgi:hypothetical protein
LLVFLLRFKLRTSQIKLEGITTWPNWVSGMNLKTFLDKRYVCIYGQTFAASFVYVKICAYCIMKLYILHSFSTLLLVLIFPWPDCFQGRLNQWSHVSLVFWRSPKKVPIRRVSNLVFHGFPQSFYADTEITSCNNSHLFHFTLLLLLFVGWDWVPRYLLKSLGI